MAEFVSSSRRHVESNWIDATNDPVQLNQIPSLHDTSRRMAQSATDGVGEDGIGGELIRLDPEGMAMRLHPILFVVLPN